MWIVQDNFRNFEQYFLLKQLTTGLDVRQSIIQLCASSNQLPNTGEGWLASLKQHGNLIYYNHYGDEERLASDSNFHLMTQM